MNKRQKKKEFKKIVGFNPDKRLSMFEISFLTWALHPRQIFTTRYIVEKYQTRRQQVKNVENFNQIMTKRRMG